MQFYNWQKAGEPKPPHTRLSPNLRLVLEAVMQRFGGFQNGGYNRRPIRGGTSWSDHAFGAAFDWNYGEDRGAALAAIDWLISHHERLGVQVIHDYLGCRLWRVGEGWRSQTKGSHSGFMGALWATWLHVGTGPEFWSLATPIAQRGVDWSPAQPVPPEPHPGIPVPPLRLGDHGLGATMLIDVLKMWKWYPTQFADDRNDGTIGARADAGIKAMQKALGVTVDGIYGPATAAAYGSWLAAVNDYAKAPTPPPADALAVKVEVGDGWIRIARRLGVEPADLVVVNRALLTSMLHPGDQLAIPGRSIRVAAGDGWIWLAKILGVTDQQLRAANPTVDKLHPNMILADPRAQA